MWSLVSLYDELDLGIRLVLLTFVIILLALLWPRPAVPYCENGVVVENQMVCTKELQSPLIKKTKIYRV